MEEYYVYYCKQCRMSHQVPVRYSFFWEFRKPPKPELACPISGEPTRYIRMIKY